MQYTSRMCSICDSNQFSQSAIKATVPAEAIAFDALESQWSGFFKAGVPSFFTYHLCTQCKLLFCPKFFTPDQLAHMYKKMPDNTANQPLNLLRKTQKSYYAVLSKYIPEFDGDYFEMGPDVGLFTEHIIDTPRHQNFWLAEPNELVWNALQEKMKAHPYLLFSDLLTEDPIPNKALKTAVIIHVLDHLLDPLKTLLHLRKKMKENAVLLIVTHDYSSLLSRILKHRWPAYCLQHPQLFNSASMKLILSKSGFETVAVKKSCNYFPPGYLLKHLLWALGVKNIKIPELSALSFPLRLGNMITIAKAKESL